MAGTKKFKYPTSVGAGALVVEADDGAAESVVRRVTEYFDVGNVEFHRDRFEFVQDALLQVENALGEEI